MSKRTDEMLVLERSPSKVLTAEELRGLILGGTLGPAVRARYVNDDAFFAVGVLPEFRPIFQQLQPKRMPIPASGQTPWLIWLFVGLIVRVYGMSLNGEWHWLLQGMLMNDYAAVIELGEWHRVWTAALVHQSLAHMLLNVCMLGYVGYQIENRFTAKILAWIIALSTALGSLLSLLYEPMSASVGASAAVYALLTLAVGLGIRGKDESDALSEHLGWFLMPYLVLAIVLGLMSHNVDHAGHFGGFLIGALFAWWLPKRHQPARGWWIFPSMISGLALSLLISLSWKGDSWVSLTPYSDSQGLSMALPTHWKSGWGSTGEAAWLSPTVKAQLVVESIIHATQISDVRQQAVRHLQQLGTIRKITHDGPVTLGGTSGWYWEGVVNQVDGERAVWLYVLCRGQLEHYIIMTAAVNKQARYRPYWTRIMNSIRLELPEELQRLALPSLQSEATTAQLRIHAEALYKIGHLPAALEAYERILEQDPSAVEAMNGRLLCLTALKDPALEQAILEALPWMRLSESLARTVVPLLSPEQLKYWLPELQRAYPSRRWFKSLSAAEE